MPARLSSPHAPLALCCLIAGTGVSIALLSMPAKATPPRESVAFICPDFAPLPNRCTNQAHVHYFRRMNQCATNCGRTPGGSVGIRVRPWP